LRATYTAGVTSNCPEKAQAALKSWISWARRSRLEPFKKLATTPTLKDRLAGVVHGMLNGRSNAYVEAMNGMLQQTKRAAREFRTVKNFVVIACLRMGKLNIFLGPLCNQRSRCVQPDIVLAVHFH
jgi:transposase